MRTNLHRTATCFSGRPSYFSVLRAALWERHLLVIALDSWTRMVKVRYMRAHREHTISSPSHASTAEILHWNYECAHAECVYMQAAAYARAALRSFRLNACRPVQDPSIHGCKSAFSHSSQRAREYQEWCCKFIRGSGFSSEKYRGLAAAL